MNQCLDLHVLIPPHAHKAGVQQFYTLRAALCRGGDEGGRSGEQLIDLGLTPLWLVMIGPQSPSGCF